MKKNNIKVIELFQKIYNHEKTPKKIKFVDEIYEKTFEDGELCPIVFLYRNINDREDYLFRDYGIDIEESLTIITKPNREIKKVRCVETNKIFKSPATAGRYYGFENGDMVSKVCRHVRESAKGLHFEYLEKGDK